jgi:hypothetical protein
MSDAGDSPARVLHVGQPLDVIRDADGKRRGAGSVAPQDQ